MTESDLIAWFDDLLKRAKTIPVAATMWRSREEATVWLTEARAALDAGFPASHVVIHQWTDVLERAKTYGLHNGIKLPEPYANAHFDQSVGVVRAARGLIADGRLRGVLHGVQAETVSEVLDQAAGLLKSNYTVAATVLAGGGLETHLLHLCGRNGIPWQGDGSITKYNQAIAQARNAGKAEVYVVTDTKLIDGWGGMRNDAAHDPTRFNRTVDEVRLMIEGIRQFIARVP